MAVGLLPVRLLAQASVRALRHESAGRPSKPRPSGYDAPSRRGHWKASQPAITILEGNLDRSGDWIVTNVTLQVLAVFARTSPPIRARLVERLHHYQHSPYKSIASRARNC